MLVDIPAYCNVIAPTQLQQDRTSLQESEIVTPVADLERISQTWQAVLQRYGCNTENINRSKGFLSRYEFATDLNTCLDQVSKLIVAAPTQEDLIALQKLQKEFAVKLTLFPKKRQCAVHLPQSGFGE